MMTDAEWKALEERSARAIREIHRFVDEAEARLAGDTEKLEATYRDVAAMELQTAALEEETARVRSQLGQIEADEALVKLAHALPNHGAEA